MVKLTHERLKSILEALATRADSQEGFLREAKSTFLMIGDEACGIAFKSKLAEALSCHKFVLPFVTRPIVEAIQKLNYPPLTLAFAKRLPEEFCKVHFPEIFEDAVPAMGTTTTTANTAPFAIPLGSLAPSKTRGPSYTTRKPKKNNKRKKR